MKPGKVSGVTYVITVRGAAGPAVRAALDDVPLGVALFVGLNDPGGTYGYRLPRMALNAVAGALLTVLGFAIGDGAWGVVVLAAFVITLAAGLMVKYGLHGFTAA